MRKLNRENAENSTPWDAAIKGSHYHIDTSCRVVSFQITVANREVLLRFLKFIIYEP